MRTYRVLIVEDDDDAAELARLQLVMVDGIMFDLSRAATRAEAIDLVLEREFDAALLDLELPDAVKFETLRDLSLYAPDVAIVALTSFPETTAFELLRNGASDFVSKADANGERLSKAIAYSVERKAYEAGLRLLADTDPLTGIGNRRHLRRRFSELQSERGRQGGSLIALAIDLDGFKALNDTKGHAVGDVVLEAVANALTETARIEDVVVRLGGDEFVVVLLDHSAATAPAIVARFDEAIRQELVIHDPDVGVSIGSAVASGNVGLDELLEHADRMLYEAKSDKGGGPHRMDIDLGSFDTSNAVTA